MPFIEISTGAELDYEDVGSGDPLIMLHGWYGTGRLHLGTLIDAYADRYRVLAPTLRGYGQSKPKPRDFPIDFYHRDARDVLAFMDALAIERAHLIGYSDGGETALVTAGLAPHRFRSVAAWGAVGFFGAAMRPWVQSNYPPTWFDDETKALHGVDDPNPPVLEWVRALTYMIDSGGDVSLSLAPGITCPVLLMLGVDDHLNPAEYGQRFADSCPDGRLILFQTGHACHDQAPEAFRHTLDAFLASAPA